MKNGKVIAVCNQKGGVGKTTTTMNLGYALVKLGKKVLLIDFDPQANLTMCFGYEQPEEIEFNIAHLMMDAIEDRNIPSNRDYIISKDGVDLIPSSIELSAVDVNLISAMNREMTLDYITDAMRREYDYILIDCLPSLGMLTTNALAACDEVLITATPQYLSAKGLELLLKTIFKVKRRINPRIDIAGILITMYSDRTIITRDIIKMLNDVYSEAIKIYENKIPVSVKVTESNFYNKSIIDYQPNNNVSKAYTEFAKEYLENERV